MMKFHAIFLAFIALFFSACANKEPLYDYSAFLSAKPRSILVLMPTNETTEIKASAAVAANSVYPLAEAGYYVFPPALVYETFRANGISEPTEIAQVPLNKLKQYFNADSVLYINITQYGTSYKIINSQTSVALSAKLVDINTAVTLWERSWVSTIDSANGNNNIIGLLISAVVSQIENTAKETSYDLSAVATSWLFSRGCSDCLLYGPRSVKYRQDPQLIKDK